MLPLFGLQYRKKSSKSNCPENVHFFGGLGEVHLRGVKKKKKKWVKKPKKRSICFIHKTSFFLVTVRPGFYCPEPQMRSFWTETECVCV